MYNLNHPSHVEDLKKTQATKEELIAYLGSEELFNQFLETEIITDADKPTTDESQDTQIKSKSDKHSGGNKKS